MRRPSALLAAALVAGGLAVATAPAANASTTITLSGSSSGYVNVTFTASTTLNAATATYSGGSSYAGFYIGATPYPTGPYLLGVKQSSIGQVHNPAFGTTTFPAGTYKLFLLTDGSATITIPATGLASSLSVSPSTSVSDQAGTWATPTSFSNNLWTGDASRTISISGDEVLFVVGKFTFPTRVPAQYTETGVCVVPSGSGCPNSGQTTIGPNATAGSRSVTMQVIQDGSTFGAGSVDFRSHYLGLDNATSISTFSLVVPGVA